MPIAYWPRVFVIGLVLIGAGAGPVLAQGNAKDVQWRAGVFERLLTRLETLPARWNHLPAPVFEPSGRQLEDVVKAANKSEQEQALALIGQLVQTPPTMRLDVINQARQARELTEVDLSVPGLVVEYALVKDVQAAALTVDAWLDLCEQLGRRDMLFVAAGVALQIVNHRIPPARILPAAEKWASLSPGRHGQRGAAILADQYGGLLFRAGHNRRALRAYR